MTIKRADSAATTSPLRCSDQSLRLQAVRDRQSNGLDYVEVCSDQRRLKLFFIGQAPYNVTLSNLRIDGGVRIRDIKVVDVQRVERGDDDLDDFLIVTVDRPGDFSIYTLRLVEMDANGKPSDNVLEGFDPRYAQLDFSFKIDCPSDFDCLPVDNPTPHHFNEPKINYLAKDYASFRQLIFDRLATVMPEWKERHIPDLGVTLVELLAYTGDYLSYYQDAVATEAYLDTARRRISVRRHARLVDYSLHEGCNARTWVAIETNNEQVELDLTGVYFTTRLGGDTVRIDQGQGLVEAGNAGSTESYEVFEPIITRSIHLPEMKTVGCGKARSVTILKDQATSAVPFKLYKSHNQISFYTWDGRECCLPRGATRATLNDGERPPFTIATEPPDCDAESVPSTDQKENAGQFQQAVTQSPDQPARRLHLKPGDVLIFEEIKGPLTGNPADADPQRRHAVRLTKVVPGFDPLHHHPIVEIEWDEADATPFDLCLSTILPGRTCKYLVDVSVARGNILLVDHGMSRVGVPWMVEADDLVVSECEGIGKPADPRVIARPFKPTLQDGPLVNSAPFPLPRRIAAQQAQILATIRPRVIARVTDLWRSGRRLNESEISELATIFGQAAMIESLRSSPPPKLYKEARNAWLKLNESQQAVAVGWLLQNQDRWLSRKFERLSTLRKRALSGYIGGRELLGEISELFGKSYCAGLEPNSPPTLGPASSALDQDPHSAVPSITLIENEALIWSARFDLLASEANDRHFVVEVDDQGLAQLRFGDDQLGRSPEPGSQLTPRYRIGGGRRGNVGREAVAHLVFHNTSVSGLNITRVRNPLPAQGGTDPEPKEEAKLAAPHAFRRKLQRAVTADDYATLAMQHPKVQRAAADLRWNGCNYSVQVAVDQVGTGHPDPLLLEEIADHLHIYRRIGHDVIVKPAQLVPLDIMIEVSVWPNYLKGHIKAELRDLFSSRVLRDGRRGFFHPDNLTFGEGIFLSRLVALAQSVSGVESVCVTRLQRLFEKPNGELEAGILPLGRLEIARLDNDPSFPEHGQLTLLVRGGR